MQVPHYEKQIARLRLLKEKVLDVAKVVKKMEEENKSLKTKVNSLEDYIKKHKDDWQASCQYIDDRERATDSYNANFEKETDEITGIADAILGNKNA